MEIESIKTSKEEVNVCFIDTENPEVLERCRQEFKIALRYGKS